MTRVRQVFEEAAVLHDATSRQSSEAIERAAGIMRDALARGGKILVFGNGGSAADSQHFAAELVNKFQIERRALAAVALTTDSSILTSVANDLGYPRVFARQIEALGRRGDVALAISTSGRSRNVIDGLEQAAAQGLTTVALVGAEDLASHASVSITVPSASTPRVQEVHRTILHVLCELIEGGLS